MAEPEIEVEAVVPSVSWLAEVTPVMVVTKVAPEAPAPCTAMASPTMLESKAPAGSLNVVLPEVTVPPRVGDRDRPQDAGGHRARWAEGRTARGPAVVAGGGDGDGRVGDRDRAGPGASP